MMVMDNRSPGIAEIVSSYAAPGVIGPGELAPTGVLKTMTDLIPFPPSSDLASLLGSPSSDWASRPLPRSLLPAVKIGALSVWTIAAPGENARDHFTPLDAVNASGLVMFSTRRVNLVGLSPLPEATPATPKKAPKAIPKATPATPKRASTVTANIFVNICPPYIVSSFVEPVSLLHSKPVLTRLDAAVEQMD